MGTFICQQRTTIHSLIVSILQASQYPLQLHYKHYSAAYCNIQLFARNPSFLLTKLFSTALILASPEYPHDEHDLQWEADDVVDARFGPATRLFV